MLDKYLVEHCAPTLASLKTANVFRFAFASLIEFENHLNAWNKNLNPKGVAITALQVRDGTALVYVYRPAKLKQDLKQDGVASFLSRYGYRCFHADAALDRLRKRLDQTTEFPHEIGLFLGYPLGDVKGFIQNSGKNSKCCGSWKVYCNESETEKLFEKFQKCRLVYCRLFLEGRSVIQLTVAA